MRVPVSWIRDFTPADAPTDALVGALNQLGLEVEAVEEPGREIAGVRLARILDVLPHPDAEKLRLADVDHGDGQTRVVCGAPNIYAGMVVPYAPVGATLPGGVTLQRRKIRGVVSEGMLCSARELGLGDDHDGILDLSGAGTFELGVDVRETLGLDDVIFDLAITPNRPDEMCVVGVARELAAHFGWPLMVPEPRVPADVELRAGATVVVDEPERCPRYVARVARVDIGPAPDWMARRLVKAGVRSISNVVDVTNYVLLERNQPLHAFDLGRLDGRGIVVRMAAAGERMTTLDGLERELTAEDLLICDAARRPQAIAGIMGGSTAEVSDATAEMLLESAYFEPMGIARSSKRLKLRSESSARFERGIDPEAVARNADRALELLVEVAGARVAAEVVDVGAHAFARPRITVRTAKVNGVLGTALSAAEIRAALVPLGIDVEGTGDDLAATPPTWRPDLVREIDLVEEVARRVGFDAIGRTVPKPEHQVGGLSRRQRERRLVADVLVGAGLDEAITIPLVAPGDLDAVGVLDGGATAGSARVVEVANPLRVEESVLRTSLLPGLLRALAHNRAHGIADVSLFEVGRVFLAPESPSTLLPDEPLHVAGVLAGAVSLEPLAEDRPLDGHDALDVVRQLLAALELADTRIEPAVRAASVHGRAGSVHGRTGFRPGRAAVLVVDGEPAGNMGELAPSALTAFELAAPVAAFELSLDRLLAGTRRDRAFRRPSPFPPAGIDLAFVVSESVAAGDVLETLAQAGGDLVEGVRCFDVFRSDTLGEGSRSLAFRLRFRAPDRTMTDREVAELRGRCITAVEQAHGGRLRG